MTIEIVIEPRTRDMGGFTVGRVLPFPKRRMVGPFIFFDEMGPTDFKPGTGIDVRPHPHIGLATVTYFFSGEIRHKDSLGYDQIIRPGDVNWMTAGKGVTHSERTDKGLRESGQHMHGIQIWVALPKEAEQTNPSFHHHPKETLPLINCGGVTMRLIAGSAFGKSSPVKTFSPIFYLAAEAENGVDISLPDEYEERALYVVSGEVEVDGGAYDRGKMIVFKPETIPNIRTNTEAKIMLLGGAPLEKRIMWWNYAATSQDKIDKAKADWLASTKAGFKNSAFALPPGETEFIPLPDK